MTDFQSALPPSPTTPYTGAALTGNAATPSQGRWQFSTNGGRSWTPLPTNLSVDGSAALLLASDTLIRFAPAADFNGTPGSLNLRPLTQTPLPWITAALPYGNQQGFIASWISDNQDGSGQGIYAQRFSADGIPIGAEFRVNSTTSGNQATPDLTQLSGGRFLISWHSDSQDGSSWGVYGQLYNADGTPSGPEFRINTTTNDQQIEQVVAALPDGGFVVSWMSHAQDGSSWGVYAQRYDATGAKAGGETLVNTTTNDQQHSPSIAVLTDGSYLIAFQGANHPGGSGWDIYAQRFSSSGDKLAGELRLNDAALGNNQHEPAIAALPNGGYIATWQDDGRDGSSWGIYARSFLADGTPTAAEFLVTTTTGDQQAEPELAVLADGSFVITWRSHAQDGSSWGIYAQHFAPDGSKLGTEFRVNTRTDNEQLDPDITAQADGGFVISWQSVHQDGHDWGVYAQRFAPDGTRAGSEFRLNSYTSYSQHQVNISSWSLPLQNLASLGLANLPDPLSLSIAVTPLNDRPQLTGTPAPLAGAAAAQTFSFSAADLLTGYTDVEGNTLSISTLSLVNTAAGTLTGNATNGWSFSPAANFIGTVDLAFSVTDGIATANDHASFSIGIGAGGNGTENRDRLIGTAAADTLNGLGETDVLDGLAGDDTLDGGSGSDQLRGGTGNDTLRGGADEDQLWGGSGNDALYGDGGSDLLSGHSGDDRLEGGTGADVLSGDAGNDALYGGSDTDQLKGGDGSDLLSGDEGDDALYGGAGNDWLIGGPGTDTVRAEDGDDRIIVIGNTSSSDLYDGGDGSDSLITGRVSWHDAGTDFRNATIKSIERLELLPSSGWGIGEMEHTGAFFSVSQLELFSWIGATSDQLYRNSSIELRLNNLSWDWGPESRWLRLTGDGTVDLTSPRFDANSSFRLRAYDGNQTLAGNEQSNWIAAGDGDDILIGRSGNDTLYGEWGNDRLDGGDGDDTLEAGGGNDSIDAGSGDDFIRGGGGTDTIDAGSGNDIVELSFNGDSFSGKQGPINDRINAGSGDGDVLRLFSDGRELDLRNAAITGFERLEVGTTANIRISSTQYSQFRSIGKTAGFEDNYSFALDLSAGESLAFANNVGLNSAAGSFSITGIGIEGFSDTLTINTDSSVDLSNAKLDSVESLAITRGTLKLSALQWNSFSEITAKGASTKRIILTESTGIDLSKFNRSADSNTTIELSLTVDQINSNSFGNFAKLFEGPLDATDSKYSSLFVHVNGSGTIDTQTWPQRVQFNIGKASFAHLELSGDESNNTFELRQLGTFAVDGGDGEDTLRPIAKSDFSKGTLTSIEKLEVNDQEIRLGSSQFNSFKQITGNGLIRVNDTGLVRLNNVTPNTSNGLKVIQSTQGGEAIHALGTKGDDILEGDRSGTNNDASKGSNDNLYGLSGNDLIRGYNGNDQLTGGAGNDRIEGGSGFNTAVFNDIQSNYQIRFLGREIHVEHLKGGIDGKDILLDIQRLRFSDSEFKLDDITNYYDPSSENNSEIGKRNRGKIDYGDDWDNWSMPLIANSRIEVIKSIHEGSASGSQIEFDGDIRMYRWEEVRQFNIDQTGIYNLRAMGTEGVEYGITARMIDDKPDNQSTTSVLTDPGSIKQGIDPTLTTKVGGFIGFQNWGTGGVPMWDSSDIDWIRVDLVGGIQYEFNALGASSQPATGLGDPYLQQLRDPRLLLLDESGQRVGEGQLGGEGQDPSLVYRANRNGAYYLAVSSASGLYTGAYTLTRTSLDEYGGDINTNGQLNIDRPLAGVINTTGDQDWFRITMAAGERLVLDAQGSSTNNGTLRDPWLGIYSSTGQLLVSDNNGGRGLDSRLSWAAPTNGTYFVATGSLGNQSTGSYILRARSKEDDAPDRLSSAFSYDMVSVGLSISGDLEVRGDRDWYQTVLLAGRTYRLTLSGEHSIDSDYAPLGDPSLILRDATGQIVNVDDDSGNGLDAELLFRPLNTGRFYLEVQDATDRYDGHYRLAIEEADDDNGDSVESAQQLGSEKIIGLNGRIDYRGDNDLFAISLQANNTYRLDLEGLSSGNGSLADPRIRLLNLKGDLISEDDNSGIGNDASLYYVSQNNETIYLEASATTGQLGSYKLKFSKTDLPGDDIGNDTETKEGLAVGATRTGTLLTPADTDWFRINLERGQHYSFQLDGIDSGEGTLEDPALELRDATGKLLSFADNGTLSRNAALGFEAPYSGTYYVVARGSTSANTGSYRLSSYAPDEAGNGFSQAQDLEINSNRKAAIQSAEDRDWFRFQTKAGQTYTLTVTNDALEAGGLPIALTELFDSTGTSIAAADGRYTDGKATLAFKSSDNNEYTLVVRGYWDRTGSYTINLSEGNLNDDAGVNFDTSIALEKNTSLGGLLEVTGDRDWYNVKAEAGHTYRFRLTSEYSSVRGALADPVLKLLTHSSEEIIELGFNDNTGRNAGISLDSEIIFKAEEDATLVLEAASSNDSWQGAYRISTTDLGLLEVDDHTNYINEDPQSLQTGLTLTGAIETNGDVDLFRLNLKMGVNYQILLKGESSNGGNLVDPQFRLLDSDGQHIASAFDGINNPDAALTISVLQDATYYLEVGAATLESNIGSYTVELVETPLPNNGETADLPSNTTTQEFLKPGIPLEGKISIADDVDWIRVKMDAQKLYIFDLSPRIINSVGGWNPALELIDANGLRLTSDDDSGEGLGSRIVYQARQDGTYYLSVRSKDGSTGLYEINQKELISGNSDPLMSNQWHLKNQNGIDLNIESIWKDYNGDGIRVGVIDDGINYSHLDLAKNLDLTRDKGESSSGQVYEDANLNLPPWPESGHGTSVAGLIGAERFNEFGGVGVAYAAKLTGFEVDWSINSIASMLRQQVNNSIGGMDITNNSWGFTRPFADDFDSPLLEPLAETLKTGVEEGRLSNGQYLGINWVFAAGNSRSNGDNTNYHNFQNSRFVTTVASTDGNGATSTFSTPGASILVSAFGENLLTTGMNGFEAFSGTSGSAALVSGVIALMLEANPNLGYRDIQQILAYSARQETNEGFKFNGATDWNGGGLHISHDQGFGLVDAHAAVRLAETWNSHPQTAENEQTIVQRPDDRGLIPDASNTDLTFAIVVEREINLEWVEVELDIRHRRINDIVVELISPTGTVARLIDHPTPGSSKTQLNHGADNSITDRIIFNTSAGLFRGESSVGTWSLRLNDRSSGEAGELRQWGLKLHGSAASNDNVYIYTDEFGVQLDETRSILVDGLPGEDPLRASGYDTINAAAITTASLIDLTPGSISRIAKRVLTIDESSWIEAAIAGDGDDVIIGNKLDNKLSGGQGNDRFIADEGNDLIDGGKGFDQLVSNANRKDFSLVKIDEYWTLTDLRKNNTINYGQDKLCGIERLVFNDQVLDLNLSNHSPLITGELPSLSFSSDVVFNQTINSLVFQDQDVDNANGDSLSYSLKLKDGRSLPAWLTFNPDSLELYGQPYPAITGEYNLELTATDAFGASAALDFSLTIIGSSTVNTNPIAPTNVAWSLDISNPAYEVQGYNVGDTFDVKLNAADLSNPDGILCVFSGYADLHYDPKLIRVVELNYSDSFKVFRAGTNDNANGVIKDLGASLSSFSPITDTSIATVRFEVIRAGDVELSLRPSFSRYLETTVFGLDGDQRPFSSYEAKTISLSAPQADLAVNKFELTQGRSEQGIIEFNYEISNYGHGNSQGSWIKLRLSDDQKLDIESDPVVWQKYMEVDALTGISSTGGQTAAVQLPRDVLYRHALAEDLRYPSFGTLSTSKDWLFISIESESEAGDALTDNNTLSNSITYFPWDIDNNGRVTMSDAIAMINRIGDAPLINGYSQPYDLNGDMLITQSEAMAVYERIGLQLGPINSL